MQRSDKNFSTKLKLCRTSFIFNIFFLRKGWKTNFYTL